VPIPKPTPSELDILRVLWRNGPATVRAVHEQLGGGYTTYLKLLQIMAEKGLVTRTEADRAHIYSAVPSEHEVQTSLLGDLMQRAFGGSAAQLALRALETRRSSREELAQLRAMLDNYEQELTAPAGAMDDTTDQPKENKA
jgi:predicted transcriptional regulator